ncbi:MAG: OB-fold nucleic acid binding domain-containing protein [Candidatus Pacearchaeota archaeon]
MPEEIKKRFTAFKVSLGLLSQGSLEFEQERFSRLILNNKEIVRVNIIATVVDKFMNDQGSYAFVTIDDGTGNIRVKVFSDNITMLKDLQLGDTLLVIGLLRHYNDELYILPEIVKQVDARWLLARKLELQKEYGSSYETKPKEQAPMSSLSQLHSQPEITEEKIESAAEPKEKTLRDQVLEIIKSSEPEEGIDVDKLIMSLKAPVDNINSTIIELLEEGTIFEPRPGRLRVL